VPHVDGRGRGDVLVPIVVDIPTKLGKGEEELLRQLAEERGDAVSPPEKGLLGRIKSAFS
jgi:molecular chaperone DnaJ